MNERSQRQVDVLRAIGGASGIVAAHRWPREQLERHRDQRLRGLARHARAKSPFHAERLRGLDLDAPDLLARLPTMDKDTMMHDLPRVLTDPHPGVPAAAGVCSSMTAPGAITTAVRRRLDPLEVAHTPLHVRTVDQIPRPNAVSGKFKLVRARAQDSGAGAPS